jgi:hypothetical protein
MSGVLSVIPSSSRRAHYWNATINIAFPKCEGHNTFSHAASLLRSRSYVGALFRTCVFNNFLLRRVEAISGVTLRERVNRIEIKDCYAGEFVTRRMSRHTSQLAGSTYSVSRRNLLTEPLQPTPSRCWHDHATIFHVPMVAVRGQGAKPQRMRCDGHKRCY